MPVTLHGDDHLKSTVIFVCISLAHLAEPWQFFAVVGRQIMPALTRDELPHTHICLNHTGISGRGISHAHFAALCHFPKNERQSVSSLLYTRKFHGVELVSGGLWWFVRCLQGMKQCHTVRLALEVTKFLSILWQYENEITLPAYILKDSGTEAVALALPQTQNQLFH